MTNFFKGPGFARGGCSRLELTSTLLLSLSFVDIIVTITLIIVIIPILIVILMLLTCLIHLAYLVIGIPTAHRKKAQYLTDSLEDLVRGLNESEKRQVVVIVFATDFEEELREAVVNSVARNFRKELQSGLIQVVEAPASSYPPLTNIPPLWKDKPDRIRWRSKQCIDYAILFQYCSKLGNFYLQLEDDISVDVGYLKVIKSFIEYNKNKTWSVLEFGARGFIGILYRASSLKRLSKFVQMYYWIWPVDILFRHFNDFNLHGNPSSARLNKTLFRHVGSYSSLEGQTRKDDDTMSSDVGRLHPRANNPPAQVTTTITQYIGASINETYSTSKHGAFWGQRVKIQDNITIKFAKPERISQVVIETGGHAAIDDIIGEATLSRSSDKEGSECKTFKEWRIFTNVAKLTARVSNVREEMIVTCLRLTFTKLRFDKKGYGRWLKIREIAVWTKK